MKVTKNNIDNIISKTMLMEKFEYQNAQIETINNKYNTEFLLYIDKFSEFTYIDVLHKTLARERTNLRLIDVINYSFYAIGCGIKTHHYPLTKLFEWEKWEEGYIEGFIRTNKPNNMDKEYFVWQYIPMTYLRDILVRFSEKIQIL